LAFGRGYFFLFENKTPATHFEGTFEFQLNNLKIEGEAGNQLVVSLGPGEEAVHKMLMVDST